MVDINKVQERLESGNDSMQDVQSLILYAQELEQTVERLLSSRIDACNLLSRVKSQMSLSTPEARQDFTDICVYLKGVGYEH